MSEIFLVIISAITASVLTYIFTRKIETEKNLCNKKEEVLFFTFSAISSVKNINDFFKGDITIEYDNYNNEKFSHDLQNLQIKLLHSAALIRAHNIENINSFNKAYSLVLSKEGFIQKRKNFALNIRKFGNDFYKTNKENFYKNFIETLEETEQLLWNSSFELIKLINKRCLIKIFFSGIEKVFKCCECQLK